MGKKINTILNLQDKFTPKLSEAGKKALIFKERVKNTEAAVQKVDSSLSKMAKTAAAVSAAGVAAMGAIASSCVKTYGEFQQSMSNVAGIMGIDAGSETYKKLESAAREAGKSTTKTAQESADALSYMALAGWSVEDSMNGLMPILRASEATGADLATTSDLVTDSMSALGLQTKDLQGYLDVCARAQNKSNTSLTQMQEAYIGCGGTFKMFGTKLDESGALLGVLANRGIKGSEAGNALQSTLINLTKKSGESAKAMEAIGVSAYDSKGKFKGITTVLRDVQKATAGMSEEQRNTYLTMIGGKNQLTTLNALLSGLSTTTAEGKNEFDALRAELQKCDGALDKMANTMTDNYAGALARAGSAVDDLKITVGQQFEPYITKFLNWFSEKLPNVTQKVSNWLERNIPKAVKFCKSAFETIKPAISFVVNNFSKLISVAAGVVVGLKAFSVITKVVALYKKLQAAGSALKVVQLALKASFVASPMFVFATAIGAVTTALLFLKDAAEKAKETNLAEHFGKIKLTTEEMDRAAKQVVRGKNFEKIAEQVEKFRALEPITQKLNEDLKIVEKTKWKLSVGLKLELDEQEEYKNTIDAYIKDSKEYFESAFQADWSLFDGNADVQSAIKKFYDGKSSELNRLGAEIKEKINQGFKDNVLTFDEEKEISTLIAERQKVLDELAKSEYDIKMGALQLEAQEKAKLNGGALTPETYNEIMEKAKEVVETYNANSRETYSAKQEILKKLYPKGGAKYDEELRNAKESYISSLGEASARLAEFGTNTEQATYGDTLKKAQEQKDKLIKGLVEKATNFYAYGPYNEIQKNAFDTQMSADIKNAITGNFGIDKNSLLNLQELTNGFSSEITALREYNKELSTAIEQYKSKNEKVPESLENSFKKTQEVIDSYNAINSLFGHNLSSEELTQQVNLIMGQVDSELKKANISKEIKLKPVLDKFAINQTQGTKNNLNDIFSNSVNFIGNSILPIINAKPKTVLDKQVLENSLKKNREELKTEFEKKPIQANVKVNVNTSIGKVSTPTYNFDSIVSGETSTPFKVPDFVKNSNKKTGSNATGTTYFGGGPTTINEHGYEIVDLPAGTRIYPHNTSEKMMNEKQPINVSVIVQGNIFGIDDAIEIIGSRVCDRIVETVNCTA